MQAVGGRGKGVGCDVTGLLTTNLNYISIIDKYLVHLFIQRNMQRQLAPPLGITFQHRPLHNSTLLPNIFGWNRKSELERSHKCKKQRFRPAHVQR
jgi:hypothetical protein